MGVKGGMSDKTSDKASDKRYKITLTEKQLALIGNAVETLMRAGRGQMHDLAEWLTLAGNDYPRGSDLFCLYVTERNLIQSVLEGIMRNEAAHNKEESEPLRELTMLYEAIRYQQWEDRKTPQWGAGSHKPIKCGKEPVPEIERIDE